MKKNPTGSVRPTNIVWVTFSNHDSHGLTSSARFLTPARHDAAYSREYVAPAPYDDTDKAKSKMMERNTGGYYEYDPEAEYFDGGVVN